ncbi:response regulator, partial [Leptospira meyeri]
MDTRKVRIIFLAFYVLSLIVWIAEEIFTLTNPP